MSGEEPDVPRSFQGQLAIEPGPSSAAPTSPARAYPSQTSRTYSPPPQRLVIDLQPFLGHEAPGLRRRPSQGPAGRCYSGGDYDTRPPLSAESRRPFRTRDDGYYQDDRDRSSSTRRDEYQSHPHPDSWERSRPPRSYRNLDERPSKPYYDETSRDYRERDLERGEGADHQGRDRTPDTDSIEGYNYDLHKNGRRKPIDIQNLTKEERKEVLRLRWIQWMDSDVKNHFVATIGEIVGTTMFLFFAFAGTQVANIQSNDGAANTTTGGTTGFNTSVYLYISIIFGFSLMVNVWIFFRISGGLFNPAVTLGMVLVGALPIVRAICLFSAQIIGGIAASAMVFGLFPTQFNVRTTLAPSVSLVRGVFIEAILTAELVFTIFMLAKEKHKATFIAPVGIGLALFIVEMVGVLYTGGSLNPARSFGPCVITGTFDSTHWIYWVGPMLGTCIAVFFYKFIKMLEYEMANPGQDGDEKNDPTQNEAKRAEVLERRESSYQR